MDAIAGGAGGEKLSEFRTFLLFICSGKGKKEKIFSFKCTSKECMNDIRKAKYDFRHQALAFPKKILVDLQYSYCANCCNLVL